MTSNSITPCSGGQLSALQEVHLPGRSLDSPRIFRMPNHPLRENSGSGSAYIFFRNTLESEMRLEYKRDRNRQIPMGTEADFTARGT